MKKKALVLALILLVMPVITTFPVKAVMEQPYWAHLVLTSVYPGDVFQAKGMVYIAGSRSEGTYTGTLGEGTIEVESSTTLNLAAGYGVRHVKITFAIGDGTLECVSSILTFTPEGMTGKGEAFGKGSFKGVKITYTFTSFQDSQENTISDMIGTMMTH